MVTKPFGFEGRRRMQQALQAIENLRAVVDTLIIVSNDRWATRKSSDNFDCDVCDPYKVQMV